MMLNTFSKFSILFLNVIRLCFGSDKSSEVKTLESQSASQKILSFSFEKETFRNFECSFENRILSHESIYSPPFYYNNPVKNFFTVFGLIFQYSLIKNDESFKDVIRDLFICYHKKKQNLNQNAHEFEYSHKKFNDHLNKLVKIILNILEKKNNGIVTVEEKNNRIIITQNNSSNDFSIKLFEIFLKGEINLFISEEYANAIIESHTLFYEIYLKDLEHTSYLLFVVKVHEEYEKRGESECLTIEPSVDEFENLLRSYARLKQSEKKYNEPGELEDDKNFKKFNESATLHSKMYRGGMFHEYLKLLTSKMSAKLLFEVYKNSLNIDRFFIDPREGFKDIMNSLIDILKKSLSDPDKICYVNAELTDESFENLLKNCLELSL